MKPDDITKKVADEVFLLEETVEARANNEVPRSQLTRLAPIKLDGVSNGYPSRAAQQAFAEKTVHEVSEDYTGPLVVLRLGTTGKDKTEYHVTPTEAVRVVSWFHDQSWARNMEEELIKGRMLSGPTGYVKEQNKRVADPAAKLRWPQVKEEDLWIGKSVRRH